MGTATGCDPMPIYEYECPNGHRVEMLRALSARNARTVCPVCERLMGRIISRSHVPPSGVYSYEPNIGNPKTFEKQYEAIKAKRTIQDKEAPS